MKSPKQLVLEMFSEMSEDEITNTLKSAGIEQDNIEMILNELRPKDNK